MRYAAVQKEKDPESWQNCIGHMAEPVFKIEEWMKRIGLWFPRLVELYSHATASLGDGSCQ